ncbi:hypothetical protein [Roseibium aggregatum]|uniref:Lipoprotein n=1 Tax=Roseibium aggregatum TaxID=187304 RepID=A0A939EGZ7_9HYPH|nr:hypothetical protein [Roseibium aggregatum]MBN9671364.1 hypothetical protein [Roseibium aggregatum]
MICLKTPQRLLGMAALALLTVSCDRDAAENDTRPCHDLDILTEYKNPDLPAQDKMLVLRQSGFQDKAFILELYAAGTTFDTCNRSSNEPMTQLLVDPEEGALQAIVLKGQDLQLVRQDGDPTPERPIADLSVRVLPD